MTGLRPTVSIADLRAKIAGLENRPLFADNAILADGTEGLLAAPPGLLHEIFTPERRNAGANLGFALGQARSLLTKARQALLILQLSKDADMGLPYGAGLSAFGINPDSVVIGRLESITELLWALEEAASCRAVAAVIADIPGHPRALDFTASRRLNLRAAASGTSIFFLRYGIEREATAAQLRWRLTPRLSAQTMFDPRAPTGPRFLVTLEKGRLGHAQKAAGSGLEFVLDWTENGFVVVGDGTKQRVLEPPRAAPHGAAPAALGNRLSEAG